jgi:hypothetical protein
MNAIILNTRAASIKAAANRVARIRAGQQNQINKPGQGGQQCGQGGQRQGGKDK